MYKLFYVGSILLAMVVVLYGTYKLVILDTIHRRLRQWNRTGLSTDEIEWLKKHRVDVYESHPQSKVTIREKV
jgi:hypothetical protein